MKFAADDYNILYYLLRENSLSYDRAIEWAYSQFTDDGIDPFIEKISLATDVAEILELISNQYQVYGEPSAEFLVGEAATKFFTNQITLNEALNKVLYYIDVELPEEAKTELYIAEDYFDWHEHQETEAIKHALPVFNKYSPIYESFVSKFST
jgi:hypothetical protein